MPRRERARPGLDPGWVVLRRDCRGHASESHRVTSCAEVTLLWRKLDNTITLRLVDLATGTEFEFGVRPEDALDAFNHPYAYLPSPKAESPDLLAA
jgi:hypothetical protein